MKSLQMLSVCLAAFLLLNLSATRASVQEASPGQMQTFTAGYQTGRIVAMRISERTGQPTDWFPDTPGRWTTEFVVRFSLQVKETVYTGEYVTEDQSMAPPSGWVVNQPVTVRFGDGKMFLKFANRGEVVAQLVK